jgi:hypothetical protein
LRQGNHVPRLRAAAVAIGAICLSMAVVPGDLPVQASPVKLVSTKHRLAPGVTLTVMRSSAPEQIRVLTLTQGHDAGVDLLPAGSDYPAYKHPSGLGAAAGALAAVNGDFGWDGRPKHLTMIDGEIWTTGVQGGTAFAMTEGGTRAFVRPPAPEILASVPGGARLPIASMNAGRPHGRAIAAYSDRGGTIEQPPGTPKPKPSDMQWCAARLIPKSEIGWWGRHKHGLTRMYTVGAQPDACPKTRLSVGPVAGSVVLAAREGQRGGAAIQALTPGDVIRMRWSITGWPGVMDVVGGTPMLVRKGRNVGPPYHDGDPYFYGRNPRTAVGVSKGCTDARRATVCDTFIVTDDGRQSAWSVGMELPTIANVLIHLGAVEAMNLDGGGGTVMWVSKRNPHYCQAPGDAGGCVVNRPSDATGERPSVLALALIQGPDPGDPSGIRP